MKTLPLLALLLVPLFFGLSHLYEWAHTEEPSKRVKQVAVYMNPTFVIIRAAICFALWTTVSMILCRWSKLNDEKRSQGIAQRCEALSAIGMIIYVLTITVYSVDFVMSLELEWYSTIYGALFGMGQVLAAFAFCVGLFLLLADKPPLSEAATPQILRDHGSFMLAFIMIWAYLGLSQFLLIWAGNLPEETPWYIKRLENGGFILGLALIILHFAMPFVLLLSGNIKQNRKLVCGIAFFVLAMRVLDLVWLIVPAFSPYHVPLAAAIFYPAALVGIGGVWLSYYLRQLQQLPLLAAFNPNEEGAAHGAVEHH